MLLKKFLSITSLFIFVSLPAFATGNEDDFTVKGFILNEEDEPLANLKIVLYSEVDDEINSTFSDEDGAFLLTYKSTPTSADKHEINSQIADGFYLGNSYPNPFNPHTSFPFYASERSDITISVYNMLGQLVIQNQTNVADGAYDIQVDLGGRLAQGNYFMNVRGSDFSLTGTMTFVSAGINSGKTNIALRPAGQISNVIQNRQIQSTGNLATLTLAIYHDSDKDKRKEFSIPPNEDFDIGTVIIETSHGTDFSGIPVIFETDMTTDCDDAGALAMMHTLERKGEATILATMVNNKGDYSSGATAAINAFYGRVDIPVGAYQGDNVGRDAIRFFQDIARDTELYGHKAATREHYPDATELYREILSKFSTNEVVIVSVGHLNNLYYLLKSEPDDHSPLNGKDLIKQTVNHIVVMGGRYPTGQEHNFSARGSHEYTKPVLENWPTEIILSGYEIGNNIRTGPGLVDLDELHPVRRAYAAHRSNPLENGRKSWDQTAVLAAVRDPEEYWKLSDPGWVVVSSDGSNEWEDDPEGLHRYLIEVDTPSTSDIEEIIEYLMADMP